MDVARYLFSLLTPFFAWWWAMITGVATLLSFFVPRGEPLLAFPIHIAIVTFIFFTLLFLTLSVIVQGFDWYKRAHHQPEVLSCSSASGDSDLETFHVASLMRLEPGQVISLLRRIGDRTMCIGMLKVERLMDDRYQCVPLWLASFHRQELKQGKLHPGELSGSLLLNESDLSRYLKEA